MRAYIAHNMEGNKDLRARLESAKSEVVATRKLDKEGVELLRRVEEGKETVEAEACQLAKEKETIEAGKKKVKEEAGQLK